MQFRILDHWYEDEDEQLLYIKYRRSYGPDDDAETRETGPFEGSDEMSPEDLLRVWLAAMADREKRKRRKPLPKDLAECKQRDTDENEMLEKFKPQLNQYKARAEQAAREMQDMRAGTTDD